MIRHIVYWNKLENTTIEDLERLKSHLLSLKDKISEVVTLDYHISQISANSFDVMLDSTFKSLDDLKAYANHPLHLEFVKENNKYVYNRHAFDYEY